MRENRAGASIRTIRGRPGTRKGVVVVLSTVVLMLRLAGPVLADTISIVGNKTGAYSTATVVCEFNSQTNTFTFTSTNTSAISHPGSTSTITAIGFDLPPLGNLSASGLNGFFGQQAPSLSSDFTFSDAALGNVPAFPGAVLDFGFVTVTPNGTFKDGIVNNGLLPGESASFTVSGAAFAGMTEAEICNAMFVRFQNVSIGGGNDVGVQGTIDFQPDARINREGKALRGNNVYNTTATNQTLALNAGAGSIKIVYITIENDGDDDDSFSLVTAGTSPNRYNVRYFRGSSNVELTSTIEGDTFQTPLLVPNQIYTIRVRVKTTSKAQQGSTWNRLFTFTSAEDGVTKDAVRLTVSRK